MNGKSIRNEEKRKAQKIPVGKTLKGGDLVEDRGLGVRVKSQWNSTELGEDLK
jgi:hypothetical protein